MKPNVSAFKWCIIYENIFIFDKVMCKLLRKCHFFHIFTYALIHKYAFTFLNGTQTLFSKTRQNLLKNKVCRGHKVLGRLNSLSNGLFRDYLQAYMIQNSLSRNLCYVSNKCNFPSFRVVFLCSLNVHDTNESIVR